MRNRNDARKTICEHSFDVCLIGGGATGLGCALDAQLRGLSSVLIDAGDFVSGASSASTKLVHGGARYLRQAVTDLDYRQYATVRRALHERTHLLHRAPFLAHPLEFLVPCFSGWQMAYYTIGLKLYDAIAGSESLFPSRTLSKVELLRRMPSLRGEKLKGAVAYADGQFDDARYGITLAQTAAQQGAELLNHARAVAFDKDAQGKLSSVAVEDSISAECFPVRAKVFINCTGPFADLVRRMANPALLSRLRPSKGVHLLLPLEALQSNSALLIPKTEDGRVIFAIPWLGRLLVGTTDDEAELSDRMVVTPEEVGFLLRHINRYLNVHLTPRDVLSAFAGLRPLLDAKESAHTKNLSRDHEVEVDEVSGLISVLGGKWTTYRAMAEDGIDHALLTLAVQGTCKTLEFPLTGSSGYRPEYWKELAEGYHLPPGTARHLAQKFGTDSPKVLALARDDSELLQPLCPGGVAIRAEALWAIREEMAQTIEDVLARRIGVQFHGWQEASQSAPVVGRLLAREFSWSEAQTRDAVERYLASILHWVHRAGIES